MSDKETVVVEAVTKYGIKANGVFYNLSPRLKEAGKEPGDFVQGETYALEVWTGPKGGKSINAFKQVGGTAIDKQAFEENTKVTTLPSLPPTSLPTTKAPGGVPPVAPAKKKEKGVDSEKMTKADWANKDRSIELQAILKSVLESPALAQMSVGKNQIEVFTLKTAFYKSALQDYEAAKEGTL